MPNEAGFDTPFGNQIISRRRFLERFAQVGVLTLGSIVLPRSTSPRTVLASEADFIAPDPVMTLEQVEDQKGVTLYTLHNFPGKTISDSYRTGLDRVPREWGTQELSVLDQALNKLPPHLYKGRQIVLGLNPAVINMDPEKPPQVEVDFLTLNPESSRVALTDLAQILVEAATPVRFYSERPYYHIESDWYDKIYEILGGEFDNPNLAIARVVRDKDPQASIEDFTINPTTGERGKFSKRLDTGLNRSYPRKLIPILAGEYLNGRPSFLRAVGEYLPDQTEALYTFMNNSVFKMEYKINLSH